LPRRSLLLIVVALVATAAFSDHAQDLARWFTCGYGKSCAGQDLLEPLALATLAATIVAIIAAGTSDLAGKLTPSEVIAATLAAAVGAAFGLLRAAEKAALDKACEPEPDVTCRSATEMAAEPMFFWALFAVVVVVPLCLLPRPPEDRAALSRLYLRIGLALGAGAFLGFAVQGGAAALWDLVDAERGTSDFLVAPSGTAMAAATWAVVLLDPLMRPRVWAARSWRRAVWIGLYATAALAICVLYGLLFWASDGPCRAEPGFWACRAGLPVRVVASVVPLLVLPGLVVAGIVLWLAGPEPRRAAVAGGAVAAAIAGGAAAFGVARLVAGQPHSAADTAIFLGSHALAAAAIVVAVAAVPALVAIAERARKNLP
jgi:hypothetical protein